MPIAFLSALAPALLVQAAPAPPPVTDLAQLPVIEATGPRCALAFAIVGQWQKAGEARGAQWPDMQTGGAREFFVQAMAGLMEARSLDREALLAIVAREFERLQAAGDAGIAAMMPACLAVKRSAGL
ncbi:MAG: hypothetical protein ACK4IS_07795 [Erythrobacter sp.]